MQSVNFYSKEQTDNLLSDKADSDSVYTKLEINAMLTDYYTKSETYSKTELDNEFDDIDLAFNSIYTKNEIDGLLILKADSDSVYTKSEIDNLLSTKADTSALNNYYTKSETYTKTEIDNLLSMKANSSALADYYTIDQIDAIVNGLVPNSTLIRNYYNKTETYTKQQVNGLIANVPSYNGVQRIDISGTVTVFGSSFRYDCSGGQVQDKDILCLELTINKNDNTSVDCEIISLITVGHNSNSLMKMIPISTGNYLMRWLQIDVQMSGTTLIILINDLVKDTSNNTSSYGGTITGGTIHNAYVLRKYTITP